MKKNQLFVVGVLALVCAVSSAGVVNGSFEDGLANWANFAGSWSIVEGDATEGTHSVQSSGTGPVLWQGWNFDFTAGSSYYISGDAKVLSGSGDASVAMRAMDAAWNFYGETKITFTAGSGWTHFESTPFVFPVSGADRYDVVIWGATDSTMRFDNIVIHQVLRGDLSGDLKVDMADLEIVYSNWLSTANQPNCDALEGNINGDCIVNLKDFVILADEWLLDWGTEYFVDPVNGDDNNDGRAPGRAFKTITHARTVVRSINGNMTDDITVNLRGGVHLLPSGIKFEPADSGTNGYNIIYRAYGTETPVISGGANLSGGWTLHDSGKNIYKKTGVTGTFRQLYVNDQWGVRARKPNINANGTGDSYYPILNNSYPFEIDASHIGSWAINGVEFVYIGHWTQNRGRISSYGVSGSKATVYFKSPEHTFGSSVQNNGYFYLENAYALLDASGEWFHDRSTSTLYYIPRSGENMSTAQVIAPVAPILANFVGTSSAKVKNIRLEGITFKHNNWTETDNYGYFPGQGGHLIRTQNSAPTHRAANGAINLRYSNNISIERCTITQGGSWGIMQQDGCDHNRFDSNRFLQLASGAIVLGNGIGNVGFYDLPTGSAAYTVINNNTIDQVGFYYKDAPAIMALKTKYVSVTRNTITNVPYTAISVGFEWGDSGNQDSRNNYVAYNKIYNAVYLLDDGAGIYALGRQDNSVMEYNYISNIYGSQFNGGHPVVGVFLDNGSCYWNVRNNVIGNVSAVTYANNPPVHDNVGRYNYYNTTNVGYTAGYSDWSNNYYQTSWSGEAWNIINNSGAR